MAAAPGVPAYPITAYAVCTALGATTGATLAALAGGRSGLAPPRRELPFATVCGAVDPGLAALPGALARFDCRAARIAWQLMDETAAAVAAALTRWGADRVGLVFGTSTGGLAATEEAVAHHRAAGALPAAFDLRRQHSFHAMGDLARARFGARGPGYTVSTACSSGGKVLGCAQRLIRAGVVDAVLVGGVDSLCQTTLRGFHALSILAPTACRPFGVGREGLNLGEGGALFLVERAGDARARLLGVGESSDAYHASSPHPEGVGALAAMRAALAQAGVDPAAVDHVNAHGTGTPKNDAVECAAIEAVFGRDVPVVSTKAATGHALGAAGAIEAAFAIAALEQGWIPASLGASPRDPEIRVCVNEARRALRCRVVLSNSFGFGGSNVAVLLGAA